MNYKQAIRQRLRFQTEKGAITTEQLWDLNITDLDKLAVSLNEECEKSQKKTYLSKKTDENAVSKLKFEIVYDVLSTRIEEAEQAQKSKGIREFNQKIEAIIAKTKEAELGNKSVEELEKMLIPE